MWHLTWEFLLLKGVLHFAFMHFLSGYYYYDYVITGVLKPPWFTEISIWNKEVKQLKIIIIIIFFGSDWVGINSSVSSEDFYYYLPRDQSRDVTHPLGVCCILWCKFLALSHIYIVALLLLYSGINRCAEAHVLDECSVCSINFWEVLIYGRLSYQSYCDIFTTLTVNFMFNIGQKCNSVFH